MFETLFLISLARAGFSVGGLAGLDVPLEAYTASSMGPGSPIFDYAFIPSFDAALLIETSPRPHLDLGLRAGYQFADAVAMRCGPCPQFADHTSQILLTLGFTSLNPAK